MELLEKIEDRCKIFFNKIAERYIPKRFEKTMLQVFKYGIGSIFTYIFLFGGKMKAQAK